MLTGQERDRRREEKGRVKVLQLGTWMYRSEESKS